MIKAIKVKMIKGNMNFILFFIWPPHNIILDMFLKYEVNNCTFLKSNI